MVIVHKHINKGAPRAERKELSKLLTMDAEEKKGFKIVRRNLA